MKKITFNLAAILILGITLFSCRKNDALQNDNSSFSELQTKFQSVDQVFFINTATGGVVQGANGTVITFPANFAENVNGTPFTGSAIVRLRESLRKSQWIADGLSTISNGGVLESGGMLYINVVRADNGGILRPVAAMRQPAASGGLTSVIQAQVPRTVPTLDNMSVFLPDSTALGSANAPTNWNRAQQFPMQNNPSNYTFQIPGFSWINVDRFYNNPAPRTTVTVNTGIAATPTTKCVLVFKNTKSILGMSGNANGVYSTSGVPIGEVVDVVYWGQAAEGKLLFKIQTGVTIAAAQSLTITPEVTSTTTAKQYLDNL